MRPLSPFVTSLVILHWTSAGPAPANGDPIDFGAQNLSYSPSPLNLSVFIESTGSQLHAPVVGNTYGELQGQEARNGDPFLSTAKLIVSVERAFANPPKQLAAVVEKIDEEAEMIAARAMAAKIAAGYEGRVSAAHQKEEVIGNQLQREMHDDHQRLQLWKRKLVEPGYSYRNDVEVQRFLQRGKKDELAKLFFQLREYPELKERVEAMQRELLGEHPEALPEVLDVWLQLKLIPEDAFVMMPVSTILSEHDFQDDVSNLVIASHVNDWLTYVNKYRSLGHFSDFRVVKLLMEGREMPWMVTMLDLLDRNFGKDELKFQALICEDLRKGVNPAHLHSLNEFSAILNAKDGRIEKSGWLAIASKLESWIDYVDEYNMHANGPFTDNDVITALQTKIRPPDVTNMFLWLRRVPGMENRAKAVLKIKATRRQSKYDEWIEMEKDPKDIFSWTPIGRAADLGPGTDEARWVVILSKFEDWIDYVTKYRATVGEFSDLQIVETLVSKRNSDEAKKIIDHLQSVPDMKELADRLALQLYFYSLLESKSTPAAVFDKIDIAMFQPLSGAPVEKSDWSAVLFELEVWLDYVDVYRRWFGAFSVDEELQVLKSNRQTVEVLVLFNKLRGVPRMKKRAEHLQRRLLEQSTDSFALRAAFSVWIKFNVSPEDVFLMLPFPLTTSGVEAAGKTAKSAIVDYLIGCWMAYVRNYRSPGHEFNHDQVVEVLKKNGHEEAAEEYLHSVKDVPAS
uniref:Uncharacterized protein n=1 Tax=Peronospora matthiolae TaxID=2874970 RepID=A0AAV1UKL3_9STRA